ncbi:hypothetical protein MKW92_016848, partial [Papaver armeniacum]
MQMSGIERGSSKAIVLIETLPAAWQMDEILYELGDHSVGKVTLTFSSEHVIGVVFMPWAAG